MRPVTSEIDARETRGRVRSSARAQQARKSHLRKLALEGLETRELLAVVPPLTVQGQALIADGGFNNTDSQVNESSPVVAVNPNNPNQVVSAYVQRSASPDPDRITVEARYSTDGGTTWNTIATPFLRSDFTVTDNPPPFRASAPSVAWDANNNFYLLQLQNNTANSGGLVILSQYDAGGNNTAERTIYSWNQGQLPQLTPAPDPALSAFDFPGVLDPVLAIDNSPQTFTDPTTGLTYTNNTVNQIHIAWVLDTPTRPNWQGPWNRYTIQLLSVTGDLADTNTPLTLTYAGAAPDTANLPGRPPGLITNPRTTITPDGNTGGDPIHQYASPRIVVTGPRTIRDGSGTPTGTTQGGLVTVLYDDFGSAPNFDPPVSRIFAYRAQANPGGAYTGSLFENFVASTTVIGAASTANNPLGAAAAGSRGIGTGLSVAADNTLGSFSPFQGRIYAAYVDRSTATGNPADNTDIRMRVSDDGGDTWFNASPFRINDDLGTRDGFSSATESTSGRPQFMPQVAVDNTNGTLLVSYLDARQDPSLARIQTSVSASIDGGASFSESVFANTPNVVFDIAGQRNIVVGPIPDNYSNSNPETELGYGTRLGLAALNGRFYAAWPSNGNGGNVGNLTLTTTVATGVYAAGPRVVSSTMGAVGSSFSSFQIEFDRPVEVGPGSLEASTISVIFNAADPNGPQNVTIPVSSVVPLNSPLGAAFGATRFQVNLQNTQTAVGTYRYTVAPTVRDRVRLASTAFFNRGDRGNTMDQDADGLRAEANNDAYAAPRPLSGIPGQAPFDPTTLPIIVNGPRVISTSVPGDTNPGDDTVLGENLVLNGTARAVLVTFDRPMQVSSFTAADVLRIDGPTGIVTGPTLYPATASLNATGLGQTIPDGTGTPLISSLTIPSTDSSFTIHDLEVRLAIRHDRVADLSIVLVAPDGTRVRLINRPTVTGRDLTNTTFDDEANLAFTQGLAPFTNVYRPLDSLGALDGKLLEGQWRLEITDNTRNNVGTLDNWALLVTPRIGVAPVNASGGLATQFIVTFPVQSINGTYSVLLGPDILSQNGESLDTNRNAGLDRLRNTPNAPDQLVSFPSGAVPLVIAPGATITSAVTVNQDFAVQGGVLLTLNALFPDVTFLEATLTRVEDNAVVSLFSGPGNIPGNRANFTNTIFDDAATTPIQANNAQAPFLGRFNPQTSLNVGLANKAARGTYILTIKNNSTSLSGTLSSWTLTLPKAVSGTGLGETVADQATTSFRLFTMDPTDPVSSSTWTAVGPTRQNGSRMTGLAVDPSDPTGNTVYVGGASSGIWKTTNFLTTSPLGPTYVPLTTFGPTLAMNTGGITVLGRNGDTRQSMIFVITGEGDTGSPGAGILRSMDGGASWQILDSLVNVDAAGNPLPRSARTGEFVGLTSFKIVVDPRPRPNGDAIVYAAFSGDPARAGVYRSFDSGKNWQRLRAGQATDIVLDPLSGTVDAVSNPNGNLQTVYAAFRGEGVYASFNQGQNFSVMAGGVGKPLVQTADRNPSDPIPVNNLGVNPNGPEGRIVLAKPELLGDPLKDQMYQGWLYAVVVRPDNRVKGLYLTKDYGQNWTLVRTPTLPNEANLVVTGIPTNDTRNPDYDVSGGPNFAQGNYDIGIAIDPNDPNVVYMGGSRNGQPAALIRVDSTRLSDPHALYTGQDRVDGGARRSFATSPVTLTDQDDLDNGIGEAITSPFINLYRNPASPFLAGGTVYISRTASFANDGSGATWTRNINSIMGGNTDVHRMLSLRDPLTGRTRLIIAHDQGVYSGIDDGRGFQLGSIGDGNVVLPGVNRNGNLQIAQLYYGASQPSFGAAATANAMFYGAAQDTGFPQSNPFVLLNGNITHTGGGGDGTGVATDQTGSGTNFRYNWPCCGGGGTDFFQVNGVGRTFGLLQQSNPGNTPDPQWPFLGGSNFAVNPIAGTEARGQVIMSSQAGRIFATNDSGRNWFVIAEPSVLDGTYAPAGAYGAPDPGSPDGGLALNNFLYIGTSGGRIFVTRNGGASWTNISAGLDGSGVQAIVTNPTRGSGEAYAVTARGVYRMVDSRANGATWQSITSNLFQLTHRPFDNPFEVQQALLSLNAIQADYRYAIPSVPTNPNSPTFPVLYVAGVGGVFRSVNNGATWAPFPDATFNQTPRAGGYFPVADVRDLDLALGNINPTNGRPNEAGGPNVLLATTYGRGQYAIKLAPLVFDSTVRFSATLPAPNGSQGTVDPVTGLPRLQTPVPVFDGSSQTSAYGNLVTIRLLNLTGVDLNDPAAVAAAPVIGTGQTDAFGRFVTIDGTTGQPRFGVQVNPGTLTSIGTKVIGIQAVDSSGTVGNIVTRSFILEVGVTPQPPAPPTLALSPSDNSGSLQDLITNVTQPRLVGTTEPNAFVTLRDVNGNAIAPEVQANAQGVFEVRVPTPLADGLHSFRATARNSFGPSGLGPILTIQILTSGPGTAPTLGIRPQDDTGVKGDFTTALRRPVLQGATVPNAIVQLIRASNGTILATATADANGAYSILLPSDLSNGTIGLQVRATDVANNISPLSPVQGLRIVTVQGDYNADGQADLAIFQPRNLFSRNWIIRGTGVSVDAALGDGRIDVPVQGDFDGDGRTDIVTYRPSTATWIIGRSQLGGQVVNFGRPGDMPAPADFDGDGVTDLAVFTQATGVWTIAQSSGGVVTRTWLQPGGDIPVPGDYDGDFKADLAVYLPGFGEFLILNSSNNAATKVSFLKQAPGQVAYPFAADFDGDGKVDPAVFHPTTGLWQYRRSGDSSNVAFTFFGDGDVPVVRDYDGDGKADLSIYRPSAGLWLINRTAPGLGGQGVLFGGPNTDVAVPGPYAYLSQYLGTARIGTDQVKLGGAPTLVGDSVGAGAGLAAAQVAAAPAATDTSVITTASAAATTTAKTPTPAQAARRIAARNQVPTGPRFRNQPVNQALAQARAERQAKLALATAKLPRRTALGGRVANINRQGDLPNA